MEPFKNLLGAALIDAAAARLQATWAAFDRDAFTRMASEGLDGLEMKARWSPALRPRRTSPACAAGSSGRSVNLSPAVAWPSPCVRSRRYHAGQHAIDVRINGQVVASAGFTLTTAQEVDKEGPLCTLVPSSGALP